MSQIPKPHRPSFQEPAALEALAQRNDPIERMHAAHETAAVLVRAGQTDPTLTERLVTAVDEIGMPLLAEIWADRPAQSLPGALYRLYALREWMTQHPDDVAREYLAGRAAVATDATAADTDPPRPDEVRAAADEILRGAFTGDLAEALERAAALGQIVAAGRIGLGVEAGRIRRLQEMATDLRAAAALWRHGQLD